VNGLVDAGERAVRRILTSIVVVGCAASGFVALSAASAPATVSKPKAPSGVRGQSGDGSVLVSWVKPSNGGAAIDSYEVITYLHEQPRPINVFHSTKTAQTIVGLSNGKTYTFKVAAHNSVGWGALSAESPGVLVGVPSVPRNVLDAPGNAQAKVSWTAPVSDGGLAISGYKVTPRTGTTMLTPRVFDSAATTQTITGLTNAKTYSFLVVARNARGYGQATAPSADIIVGTTLAPTKVTGVPGSTDVTVSWVAPASSNGSIIDAYRVTPYLGDAAQTPRVFNNRNTTEVVTGLTRAKGYRFRVDAHNARGWSVRSLASGIVTPGTPIAPTNVQAVAGSGKATVSWTAPTTDNGATVGAYEVYPYRAGVAQTPIIFATPATSHVLTGLSHGQVYRFRVAAHNSRGWGPLSLPSPPVTPS
jgi:hypothetical protein